MTKTVHFNMGSATPSDTNAKGYQANVANGKGYHDLIVNLNANGKAIRISDKFGEQRVHVTVGQIPSLVAALQHVKDKGVKTSVEDLKYTA